MDNIENRLALKKNDQAVKPYFLTLLLFASGALLGTGSLLAIMMFSDLLFGSLAPFIVVGLSILLLTKGRPMLYLAWHTVELIFDPNTYKSIWMILHD